MSGLELVSGGEGNLGRAGQGRYGAGECAGNEETKAAGNSKGSVEAAKSTNQAAAEQDLPKVSQRKRPAPV
eukprot:5817807-Pleurochrysis_carterae.AAC.2